MRFKGIGARSEPNNRYSVLMAVYHKDRADYLQEALASLARQTLLPSEVVIVEDGPLGPDLHQVLNSFQEALPLKVIPLSENRGLAVALNVGLARCSYPLVGRMDADDFSLPDRFERQTEFINQHLDIHVVGSWVEETTEDIGKPTRLKRPPTLHNEIVKFAKIRNPICHPVALFRKEAVVKCGSYPEIFPEDYALWSKMIMDGYRFGNVPEVLLRMRTGRDFFSRRGIRFLKGEIEILRFQKKIGFLNPVEYSRNIVLRTILRLQPNRIKKLLYKRIS